MVYSREMTINENNKVTIFMVAGCWFCACFIPSISDAVTLLGATTNPIVGFVLPIMFYLKLFPQISMW